MIPGFEQCGRDPIYPNKWIEAWVIPSGKHAQNGKIHHAING